MLEPIDWMVRVNPLVLYTLDRGRLYFWEDLRDGDGRCFRIEFSCDQAGRNANAYCVHNPWGDNPYEYAESHLAGDGFICIGRYVDRGDSPYSLKYARRQTLVWINGYSHFREHGWIATVRALPAWGAFHPDEE